MIYLDTSVALAHLLVVALLPTNPPSVTVPMSFGTRRASFSREVERGSPSPGRGYSEAWGGGSHLRSREEARGCTR
jgi:hypothetical protein